MTSWARETQEEATAVILDFLANQWDRPEYKGGPYPDAVLKGLRELAELVRFGLPNEGSK